jgi:uncharacterized cofD-like protein
MRAVAVGGGHGTAVTLRALRLLTDEVTGIVSVADNGGSSGRLRAMLDVAAVGDLRKCLSALADPRNPLAQHFEHRYSAGELEGHAVGNLLLAGLVDATGNLETSVAVVGRLLEITGRVLPAATEGVTLVARTGEGRTVGQTEVSASASIYRIMTEPRSVAAPESAREALLRADLVVIGPGSLFTSVLAACVVPGIGDALARTGARRVLVTNLHEQVPETAGYSPSDQLAAVQRHGVGVDVVLVNSGSEVQLDGPETVVADLAGPNGRVHDPEKLARALGGLVA